MYKLYIRNFLFYLFIVVFSVISVIYNLDKPIILVINSYNVDYSWTRDVNEGLKKVLTEKGAYNIRWHYMDTKNNPSESHRQRAGLLARRVVDEIKPNIIIAVDEDAQEYVAKYYIDQPGIDIVYSGVNGFPEAYGYDKASNVTGILERLPLVGVRDTLLEILKSNPGVSEIKLMHLSDDSGTVQADDEFIHNYGKSWEPIKLQPSVLVHKYSEWKKAVLNAEQEANCLLISNYRKIYDDNDKLVPAIDVMKWTIENSKVPIVGVNGFTVEDGAKFAVATSPFEQGEVAAKMAMEILKGKKASEIPVTQTKQFIIYMRGKFEWVLPAIYEAFARAANKYWETSEPTKKR